MRGRRGDSGGVLYTVVVLVLVLVCVHYRIVRNRRTLLMNVPVVVVAPSARRVGNDTRCSGHVKGGREGVAKNKGGRERELTGRERVKRGLL